MTSSNGDTRRRMHLRQPTANAMAVIFVCANCVYIAISWLCAAPISPAPPRHPSPKAAPAGKRYGGSGGKSSRLEHRMLGRNHSRKPRVVGAYAYRTDGPEGWEGGRAQRRRPPYVLLTERIDPHLLSRASQALRRTRVHDHYPRRALSIDAFRDYDLAIAGSGAGAAAEDPLGHLMLSSGSRDVARRIRAGSADYEDRMADPLENAECEAVPRNARWMLRASPTCNLVHELDLSGSVAGNGAWILGHGYMRDVWPVPDTGPSGKVALKTIRYEHGFSERNFARHARDAIVSERLSSSPWVVSIHGFCGNSGYFEFAAGGSLYDRLDRSYEAKMDREVAKKGGGSDAVGRDSGVILDQRSKLDLAHQVAAGIADLHDADAMRDENGRIVSAAVVHADISADQFVSAGEGIYKLNDFNRCRFMRRYRNSAGSGGDGNPCGFYVESNTEKSRSPEEFAYTVETEMIDIYSMGNIFYTILTDLDPWEDIEDSAARKATMEGRRPEVPESVESSDDFVDAALREMLYKCWRQRPKDRPRARDVADFFMEKLVELDRAEQRKRS